MSAIMVDTDVLVWVLRGRSEAIAWLEQAAAQGRLCCSALTVSEILRMAREDEMHKTNALIAGFDVVPVGEVDARKAADFMRHRGPGYVDCHIAAQALRLGAPVMTYNRKDFLRTDAVLVDPPTVPGGK